MKSIPAAMTWEIFHRDRWSLAAAAVTALALPTIILGALHHEGGFDPEDRSMLILQMVMIQLNGVIFGSALLSATLNMSRLYALPASTASLVAWRLLPAMALMFIQAAAWTTAINAMFHSDWPLWGPALLEAVALAAVIGAFWFVGGSRWVVFAITVVATVLGFWFKSRYGAMFGAPLHSWDNVTATEIFSLFAISAISAGVGYIGLSRSRHGGPPFSLGIAAWLDRMFDRPLSSTKRFASPARAHSWYVWRNGWLMPGIVVAGLVVGIVIWLFASWDPNDLVTGVFVGSRMMLLAAMCGGVSFGNAGNERSLVMSQFLATRPTVSKEMSSITLRLAFLSLLAAWGIWAAAALLAYGIAQVMSDTPPSLVASEFDWRELPALFLGSWIIVGGLVSVSLTGRSRLFIVLLLVGGMGHIALMIIAKFTLSAQAHEIFLRAITFAIGVMFVVGTFVAFAAAWRRREISAPTVWTSLAFVAALVAGATLMFPHRGDVPLATCSLAIGLLTLTVVPLAAAPRALAWNRHR
jgi:hypothetical protein